MNNIDYRAMEDAGKYVEECAKHAEIHTVTVILNGQHGGADVRIEGITPAGDDYEREYQVR